MGKVIRITAALRRKFGRDLAARNNVADTKGGIIAVLIGLVRPQPDAQPAAQLTTRRG